MKDLRKGGTVERLEILEKIIKKYPKSSVNEITYFFLKETDNIKNRKEYENMAFSKRMNWSNKIRNLLKNYPQFKFEKGESRGGKEVHLWILEGDTKDG